MKLDEQNQKTAEAVEKQAVEEFLAKESTNVQETPVAVAQTQKPKNRSNRRKKNYTKNQKVASTK